MFASHRLLSLPIVLALAGVAGCGGGAETNGLERASAADVQQKAAAALKSATSVHVRGTSVVDGVTARFDVRIEGASSTGSLTVDGTRVEITNLPDAAYVKAGAAGLKAIGAPPALQRAGAGRWLKLDPRDLTTLEGFSAAELAAQLTTYESPPEPEVKQVTRAGDRVVVLTMRDRSKLYVANTGAAYPLHGDYGQPGPARVDFTEYGVHFAIAAPAGAVGVEEAVKQSPAPAARAQAT